MNIENLLENIEENRTSGVIHLLVFDRLPNVSWEDLIIEKAKTSSIFSWHSILFYRKSKKNVLEQPVSREEVRTIFEQISDRKTAVSILAQLLHRDMAYNSELMSIEDAYSYSESFISLFSETSEYYSNSTWEKNSYSNSQGDFELGLSGWNSLTEATFDSGIIIVDKNKIGVAWFEDED